jgi:hypothetical protein
MAYANEEIEVKVAESFHFKRRWIMHDIEISRFGGSRKKFFYLPGMLDGFFDWSLMDMADLRGSMSHF